MSFGRKKNDETFVFLLGAFFNGFGNSPKRSFNPSIALVQNISVEPRKLHHKE